MAKHQQVSKGGRCRRRGDHHERIGKYVRQQVRTEANRLRKQANHNLRHPNDKEKPTG